ncbi:MAG: SLATT domain-containing protein [Kangiellaceae bacterium]|nr:SLATT domain-containing protein [Kangiellaceae bacterium]MCW8998601.1 SLATT domain-containing protein [Kangiellaceae bacterium]MCW9015416.1 SLATT domain-containing protein [Kangiellaceae bacterium]
MAFSDNIWWTRKARIQTEKRLLANAFHSQLLLLWFSFCGVAASVYYLKFAQTGNTGEIIGITWVVFSVLILCMSGFISGLSFKERAALVKESYEAINTLYQKAKQENANVAALAENYDQVLSLCENHTDYDYYQALCIEYVTCIGEIEKKTKLKEGMDRRPTWYHWLSIVFWAFRRYTIFTLLYALPMSMFYVLEHWL